MRQRWSNLTLAALVAQIPFELRYTLFGLSNLQWTFVLLVCTSAPLLFANRKRLVNDRLVQAAALFVLIQWIVAAHTAEFQSNAFKAAIRFTAGLLLLAIARISVQSESARRIWVISSVL